MPQELRLGRDYAGGGLAVDTSGNCTSPTSTAGRSGNSIRRGRIAGRIRVDSSPFGLAFGPSGTSSSPSYKPGTIYKVDAWREPHGIRHGAELPLRDWHSMPPVISTSRTTATRTSPGSRRRGTRSLCSALGLSQFPGHPASSPGRPRAEQPDRGWHVLRGLLVASCTGGLGTIERRSPSDLPLRMTRAGGSRRCLPPALSSRQPRKSATAKTRCGAARRTQENVLTGYPTSPVGCSVSTARTRSVGCSASTRRTQESGPTNTLPEYRIRSDYWTQKQETSEPEGSSEDAPYLTPGHRKKNELVPNRSRRLRRHQSYDYTYRLYFPRTAALSRGRVDRAARGFPPLRSPGGEPRALAPPTPETAELITPAAVRKIIEKLRMRPTS